MVIVLILNFLFLRIFKINDEIVILFFLNFMYEIFFLLDKVWGIILSWLLKLFSSFVLFKYFRFFGIGLKVYIFFVFFFNVNIENNFIFVLVLKIMFFFFIFMLLFLYGLLWKVKCKFFVFIYWDKIMLKKLW